MVKKVKEDNRKEKEVIENQEDSIAENVVAIEEVESLKEEIEMLNDKILRLSAENENMRRRYENQLSDGREYAVAGLVKDMLSPMDNLSRALSHLPENIDDETKNLIAGVKMTRDEFLKVFSKNKVEQITPEIGDKFDYNLHHAISQIETKEYPTGTILGIMQEGYKIKDRLLRPAAVSVSKE
jgi:molecular chaperone GrpE